MHAEPLRSCPILCGPIDYGLRGFSVKGILKAIILERIDQYWLSHPSAAAAAAAKSLQSCLPGFSVHGILQARTLE